jgi:hypothetical protein
LKLLLLGYEPDEDDDGETFPVRLPGINKLLTTRSIRHYYTAELFHYLDFYQQVKQFGLPFKNFIECPAWVLQLQGKFDGVYREIENYLTRHPVPGNQDTNRPVVRHRPHIRRR